MAGWCSGACRTKTSLPAIAGEAPVALAPLAADMGAEDSMEIYSGAPLYLRPFDREHLPACLGWFHEDLDVSRFLSWNRALDTVASGERFLESMQGSDHDHAFAIIYSEFALPGVHSAGIRPCSKKAAPTCKGDELAVGRRATHLRLREPRAARQGRSEAHSLCSVATDALGCPRRDAPFSLLGSEPVAHCAIGATGSPTALTPTVSAPV
jgi:hypothetical protein